MSIGSNTSEEYGGVADGALREGRAVKFGANLNSYAECDTAGEASEGIARHDADDTKAVSVIVRGRYDRAKCGAALGTLFTNLAVDAQGRYVAAVALDVIVGVNLTTTSAAGQDFTIQLRTAGTISA